MNTYLLEKIKRRIDSSVEDMIELQRQLTSIPALAPENGGDGEYTKAEHLLAYLQNAGFRDIRKFYAPDARVSHGCRPNIIVNIPGGRSKRRTVWILTHLDVVPPGELSFWNGNPYSVRIADGRIFGRGTEDNQQDLVASVMAAKAFLDEGVTPENSVGLVFVADEETGSRLGLEYLLKTAKDHFHTDDLIVVPDSGNDVGSMIEVAEKSMLWIRFKTTGKQCHASRPSLGRNAFRAASHLVVKLNGLYDIFSASDPLYHPPNSTFEPTRKDANVPNINTIPGDDVFYLDCRVLPRYPLSSVIAEMRKMSDEIEQTFDVTVDISPVQKVAAPAPTPVDAPVVNALKEAIRNVFQVEAFPIGIGGGTVAAPFRREGFPAAVWCRIGQSAHQPNEYCLIENMVGNAKVYAHLFLQG